MTRIVHFDMETQDPDDVFTLCILATHPKVNLRSVSIFPGGRDQVGVVLEILRRLDRLDVRVGAAGLNDGKQRVSTFHYKWLGEDFPADPDDSATRVILQTAKAFPDGILLTGAPLTNIHEAWIANERRPLFRGWTCQGGFAGNNIVPENYRLTKFEGMTTCPTFNLNGNPTAALDLLDPSNKVFSEIHLVSKNVCHGFICGMELFQNFHKNHAGLDLMLGGLETYCEKRPSGKALHDVLAAILAIDPSPAMWRNVELFRERGGWGSRPVENDYQRITVGVDFAKALEVLLG